MKKAAVLLSLVTLLVAALVTTPAVAAPHDWRAAGPDGAVAAPAATATAPAWTRHLPAWLQHVLELLGSTAPGPERSLAAASTDPDSDPDPCVGQCTDIGVIGDPNG